MSNLVDSIVNVIIDFVVRSNKSAAIWTIENVNIFQIGVGRDELRAWNATRFVVVPLKILTNYQFVWSPWGRDKHWRQNGRDNI